MRKTTFLPTVLAFISLAAAACSSGSELGRERANERIYHTSVDQAKEAVISAMNISKFHILEEREGEENETVYRGYYMRTGQQRGQMADFQVYVRELGEEAIMVRLELPSPTQYAATSPAIISRRFFDAVERHPQIAASLER